MAKAHIWQGELKIDESGFNHNPTPLIHFTFINNIGKQYKCSNQINKNNSSGIPYTMTYHFVSMKRKTMRIKLTD
jgi:hypothetical protein